MTVSDEEAAALRAENKALKNQLQLIEDKRRKGIDWNALRDCFIEDWPALVFPALIALGILDLLFGGLARHVLASFLNSL